MIVVADSGSSKTDWRIIDKNEIQQLSSIGLNPDFVNESQVKNLVEDTFKSINVNEVNQLFFYGSGSSSKSRKSVVKNGLEKVFSNAKIEIEHDLLGAARAACGRNRGLAAILGTGSNCCLFDGENIIKSYRSGGYIIGDEGGGVDFGKRIIKAFIEDKMPIDLREKFDFRYKLKVDDILIKIYKEDFPNRFLASFSNFIYQNKNHPFIVELISKSFRSFFENQVLRYTIQKDIPINAVGSIAYFYHDYFRAIAEEYSIPVGNIIEKPIAALTLYHQSLSLD